MFDLWRTSGKGNRPLQNILTATLTDALYEHIYFICTVPFGKFNHRDFYGKAISLATFGTFKMNVIVVVVSGGTGLITEGILQCSFIIKYLVDKSLVQKGLERAVHRYPIEGGRNIAFNISVRKGILPL